MTNLKSTKKALWLSVLSLLLCFSMLIGTTFAWFTDSVSSANNIITAGNLDITLEYLDNDGKWQDVEGSSEIFDKNALWEPGYTKVVYLKLQNVGSLALKYQLGVNVVNETAGTNVDGETFKLSDYIYYDVFAMEVTSDAEFAAEKFADRDAAMKDTTEETLISNSFTQVGALEADSKPVYIAMVVYMPTTVGNEANYKTGTIAPMIELGVNVFATQYTFETDSFGPDYDGEAFIPVADVDKVNIPKVMTTIGMGGSTAEEMDLDIAFSFKTTETNAEALKGGYAKWHADFVVSVDKDLPGNSAALAGYYAAYCEGYNGGNWVAMMSPDTIPAGEEIRLLQTLLDGGSMNYSELCAYVPEFLCGVADLSDGANAGTTLTVELRLYEIDETASNQSSVDCETDKYITIGTYNYSFPIPVSSDAEFSEALKAEVENIVVELDADVTYDCAAWANNAMGSAVTKTITINGNGHTITFNNTNTDWNNITANDAKLIINNAHLTNTGKNDGPWNRHDISFNCEVELNNVTSDKAIALAKDSVLNGVTIKDTRASEDYALWIRANGQTVTINNLVVDMGNDTGDRAIKIADEYIAKAERKAVTLSISNAEFITSEKATILVSSTAGANITLNDVDISGVKADSTNAVWVDNGTQKETGETYADYADLVIVNGGTKIVEP